MNTIPETAGDSFETPIQRQSPHNAFRPQVRTMLYAHAHDDGHDPHIIRTDETGQDVHDDSEQDQDGFIPIELLDADDNRSVAVLCELFQVVFYTLQISYNL
jgi:hypothetical protein